MKDYIVELHDIVAQGKGNIVSDMGGEKVMLSVHNGKYYNLGEIGGKIWEMVENPISVQQLIDALLSEYEVDRSECERQVVSFLGLLAKEGLLEAGVAIHGMGV